MIRVAIAQISSSTNKDENLKAALFLTQEARAKGAQLIAFPEFLMAFTPAEQSAEELAALAEPVKGPFVSSLRNAARGAGISVLATIYEKCSRPDRVYDTALWIDGGGGIASAYRKLHLYDAFGFKESDKFRAGNEVAPLVKCKPVVQSDAESEACKPSSTKADADGRRDDEARFGIMICYDLRFPEIARILALAGANIIVAPSGWVQGDFKVDHWRTMINARALENGCYVIAPNQVGNIYTGCSLAVDPLGRTLADLGEKEGMTVVDVDPSLPAEIREKLPLLKNRRSDVYAAAGLVAKTK